MKAGAEDSISLNSLDCNPSVFHLKTHQMRIYPIYTLCPASELRSHKSGHFETKQECLRPLQTKPDSLKEIYTK